MAKQNAELARMTDQLANTEAELKRESVARRVEKQRKDDLTNAASNAWDLLGTLERQMESIRRETPTETMRLVLGSFERRVSIIRDALGKAIQDAQAGA